MRETIYYAPKIVLTGCVLERGCEVRRAETLLKLKRPKAYAGPGRSAATLPGLRAKRIGWGWGPTRFVYSVLRKTPEHNAQMRGPSPFWLGFRFV